MNREILFRGLSIESNEWVYGFLVANINPHKEETEYIEHMIYEGLRNIKRPVYIDPKTVGQYTGLTDKNGVKIFEGDIVSYIGEYTYIIKGNPFIGLYGVDDRSSDNKPDIIDMYERSSRFEVIGNIHQNPELLNSQQS